MAKTSPLQRTLKYLRDLGWTVHITEHFNPHVKVRQDFGGFADCLAYSTYQVGVRAVNAMHLKHRTEHDHLLENKNLKVWLEGGREFELHQWHKVGERGKRKKWQVEILTFTVDMMRVKKAESSGEPIAEKSVTTSSPADASTKSKSHGRTRPVHRERTHG